jgi:hypothetical protein
VKYPTKIVMKGVILDCEEYDRRPDKIVINIPALA